MDNFRSSVTAQLNTDSQQIQETTYDPESARSSARCARRRKTRSPSRPSRIRRRPSSRTFRRRPRNRAATAPQSSDQSDKKEEQTNYEINSKTTATVRNSYKVEKLSVAVVVNKGRIAKMVGDPADQAKVDAYLAEMQKIVASAAGINAKRGDVITVNAMDFVENQLLDGCRPLALASWTC